MLEKLKEWQWLIGVAIFLISTTSGVVIYTQKVERKIEKNTFVMVELMKKVEGLQGQLESMDKQVRGNKEYATNIHMLCLEIKGELKALGN